MKFEFFFFEFINRNEKHGTETIEVSSGEWTLSSVV